jgi:hypothetical protein
MVNIPPGLVAGGKTASAARKCQSRMRIKRRFGAFVALAHLNDQADDDSQKGEAPDGKEQNFGPIS